jgi:hypothetical protein
LRAETREQLEKQQEQRGDDRAAAAAFMASPGGAALLRYLAVTWGRRGLGSTAERTAYRVAFRDALELLKDIRTEGENAR